MGRRKVTYEIDEGLARRVKATAAAEGKPEYRVVEEALSQHLLGDTLREIWSKIEPMDEDEAMDIAIKEVKAYRADRARQRRATAKPTRAATE